MKQLKLLVFTGFLYGATSFLASANSQPSAIQYKIVWHGPKDTALSAAYAVFNENGTMSSKAVTGEFPMEVELSAPPSATVTASGTSPTDTHIRVRIYRNGQVCDETVSYGKGNYATAFCSAPVTPKK